MIKRILAVFLALVVSLLAGTWYSGRLIEQAINQNIAQANALFEKAAPQLGIHLSLLELQPGFFSSQAQYQLSLAEVAGKPRRLEFSNHIQHGPFPLSRLLSGKLIPVVAQSHFELINQDFAASLFSLSDGQLPLSGDLVIHYDGSQSGIAKIPALSFREGSNSWQASDLQLEYALSAELHLSGKIAEITAAWSNSQSTEPLAISLKGLSLESDKKQDANGLFVGESNLRINSLKAQMTGAQAELRDLSLEEALQPGEKGLDQLLSCVISELLVDNQKVADFRLQASLRRLDPEALAQLQKLRGQPQDSATQQRWQGALLQLLEQAPKAAIDEISLRTTHGEARTTIVLSLQKANLNSPDIHQMTLSAVDSLRSNLKIEKPVIADLLQIHSQLNSGQKIPPVEVDAQVSELSNYLVKSHWMLEQNNFLSSSLHYLNQGVIFNDQNMSLETFLSFLNNHEAQNISTTQ